MNSEIIKNKFGDESMWNQPGFPEGFNKFIEEKTSPIGEGNDPWNHNIPLNELNINITKVDQPVFEYNVRAYQCQIRKVPLLRTYELDKNFSNCSDNSQIKKELEDFINNNFLFNFIPTHYKHQIHHQIQCDLFEYYYPFPFVFQIYFQI